MGLLVACGRTGLDADLYRSDGSPATPGFDASVPFDGSSPLDGREEEEDVSDAHEEDVLDALTDASFPDDGPSGVCFTQSVLSLAKNIDPQEIVIDDSFVYWADDAFSTGDVYRVPKSGGGKQLLGKIGSFLGWGIAIDATDVFVAEWDGLPVPVHRVPKNDGGASTVSTAKYVYGIAVDSTNVYWAEIWGNVPGGEIRYAPKGGGASALLVHVNEGPVHLVVDGGYVYYTTWTTTGGVWRIPSNGGNPTKLATDAYCNFLTVDGANVYFTCNNSVSSVPKQGGAVTKLSPGIKGSPQGIAVDATHVYWTDFNAIYRTPKNGGSTIVLHANQQNARSVQVDDDCVYWGLDPNVGEIRVGPKN